MYTFYSFMISALDRGEWFSVTPRPRFNPRERTLGTHLTASWAGRRADLDTRVRGNILLLLQGIELRSRPMLREIISQPLCLYYRNMYRVWHN
jgi:hypothetical protein